MSVPEWLNLTTDQITQNLAPGGLPHTPYASDPAPFEQSPIGRYSDHALSRCGSGN